MFHWILPQNKENHNFGHQNLTETENAPFLKSCTHTMTVAGILCFFGSISVRFELSNYGATKKERSGLFLFDE